MRTALRKPVGQNGSSSTRRRTAAGSSASTSQRPPAGLSFAVSARRPGGPDAGGVALQKGQVVGHVLGPHIAAAGVVFEQNGVDHGVAPETGLTVPTLKPHFSDRNKQF